MKALGRKRDLGVSPGRVLDTDIMGIYIYELVGGFKPFLFAIICGIILPID